MSRARLWELVGTALKSGMAITGAVTPDIPDPSCVRFSRRAPDAVVIDVHDKGGAAVNVIVLAGGGTSFPSELARRGFLPGRAEGAPDPSSGRALADSLGRALGGMSAEFDGGAVLVGGAALCDGLLPFLRAANALRGEMVAFTPEDTGCGIRVPVMRRSAEAMQRAAALGDAVAMEAFRRGEDSAAWARVDSDSPLFSAAVNGHGGAVAALGALGLPGDAGGALRVSAENGREDCLRALLDAGVDPDAGDALHFSVHADTTACTRMLLMAGADPNRRSWSGRTPLHEAACRHRGPSRVPFVELLTSFGAVQTRDNEGRLPEDVARLAGSAEVGAALEGVAVSP